MRPHYCPCLLAVDSSTRLFSKGGAQLRSTLVPLGLSLLRQLLPCSPFPSSLCCSHPHRSNRQTPGSCVHLLSPALPAQPPFLVCSFSSLIQPRFPTILCPCPGFARSQMVSLTQRCQAYAWTHSAGLGNSKEWKQTLRKKSGRLRLSHGEMLTRVSMGL